MQYSQSIKIISAIIVIILILATGYLLFNKYRVSTELKLPASDDSGRQESLVRVEDIPIVDGTFSIPTEFPQDLPLERDGVLESAITKYPEQSVQQLSVSYRSLKTVAQKYAEYKNYMTASGYQITEGDAHAPVRTISGASARTIRGAKGNANLSVTMTNNAKGETLIQLYYLLPF